MSAIINESGPQRAGGAAALTGRISEDPAGLMTSEVLRPQFDYEVRRLLGWYVRVEQVLLLEYHRMGLLTAAETRALGAALGSVTVADMTAGSSGALTDMAFTLERLVAARVPEPPARWHADRSRNDLQASVQALHGRDRILTVAELLMDLVRAFHATADETVEMAMPGFTHLQPAQVISPAFYLTAVSGQVLHTLDRLDSAYRSADLLPLGAGAMAGQELAWDRPRMARLLGCASAREHALRAVATRDWALDALAEFSNLGVVISRFVTDLMMWSGDGYRFVDLPDAWSGISSAMPQKKNYPVLERIRGRSARLTEGYTGVALTQRSTPFSNSIEVSKESGTVAAEAFDRMESVVRLLTAVTARLEFRAGPMRAACERAYLGGFTLANLLTLYEEVPWREAQIIAGRYVVAADRRGGAAGDPDPDLLREIAMARGHAVREPARRLRAAFDVDGALAAKRSAGSTAPAAVREIIGGQRAELAELGRTWQDRRDRIDSALAGLDRRLAAPDDGGER